MQKIKRKELLQSKEWHLTGLQLDLCNVVEDYMKQKELNKEQLAEEIKTSIRSIKQVLNGDGDCKISKMVDFALACNKVPILTFVNLDEYIANDAKK